MSRLEKVLIGAAFLGAGVGIAMEANAGPKCDHPNFYVKGCDYDFNGRDGADGKDGVDGRDGSDGNDGLDGRDGADGLNGIDGRDGKDGERGPAGVPGSAGRDGLDGRDGRDGLEYRNEFMRYIAATNALDIHEASYKQRVTLNAARLNGMTGIGLGFSYRTEKDSLFKIGASRSGSETLVKGSVSWEFK